MYAVILQLSTSKYKQNLHKKQKLFACYQHVRSFITQLYATRRWHKEQKLIAMKMNGQY